MFSQMMLGKIPARPKRSDKDLITKAVKAIIPEIKEWFKDDYRRGEDEDIEKDIFKAIECLSIYDGYRICKNLEMSGWQVNRELVEIMDNLEDYAHNIHEEKVKQWVIDNNIKPKLEIGSFIKFKNRSFKQSEKILIGEITRIYHDIAQYTVFCKELGHVKKGTGTYGEILSFEETETETETETEA